MIKNDKTFIITQKQPSRQLNGSFVESSKKEQQHANQKSRRT